MTDKNDKIDYKPIAEDSQKSCANCKNYQPESDDMGKCFGNQVSSRGTCNFFTPKEK